MTSVLKKYQRNPKLYIKLPSNGKYYGNKLELAMDQTLAIRAMTAMDEMLLKSPDALLNGAAIISIIKSCCPEITFDPKELIAPDVEAILLAIFHASYGHNLEFSSACPKCKYDNEFTASIIELLDTVNFLNPPYKIHKEIEGDSVEFHIKPYTYETFTKKSLSDFENAKILQYISNPELDDETKLQKFSSSFEKMAEFNFDILASSIEKIVVPEGESTDPIEIKEFVFNIEADLVEEINKVSKEINTSGINNKFQAKCQNKECGHEWTTNMEFDPASFFVASFKR